MRRALVLVVDGWGSGFLGPYGNTWLETPALNQLAAQSILFERCFTPSLSLTDFYKSCLSASHPLQGTTTFDLGASLAAANIPLHMLTDDPSLQQQLGQHQCTSLETLPQLSAETANSIEETQLAQMFSVLLNWLEEPGESELIWAHTQGLLGNWDAPLEMRNALADEEDPDPPGIVTPPCLRSDQPFDPDEILGFTQAYAAQAQLLDLLIGELLATIEELPEEQQPLLILTSSGGFPLGLHGQIGRAPEIETKLYSDTLQVPLFVRQPNGENRLNRVQKMVQSQDIAPSLLSWFGVSSETLPDFAGAGHSLLQIDQLPERDRIYCATSAHRSLVTSAWSASFSCNTSQGDAEILAEDCQLFVKPDDRWEMSDVSDRCHQVVQSMLKAAAETEKSIVKNDKEFTELSDIFRKE